MRLLLHKFSALMKKRDGAVAVTFAMTLIPIMVSVGAAVDYSRLYMKHSKVQDAIDAATMAAALHYVDNRNIDQAIETGKEAFAANCLIPDCKANVEPVIEIKPGKTITGTYEAQLNTVFMRLARIEKLEFAAKAEVSLQAIYHEFHFALDYSASMGIAADDGSVTRMENLTQPFNMDSYEPQGCAFACHEVLHSEPRPLYDLAMDNDIPLREDTLYTSAGNAAEVILERITGTHADQIRVGAFAFSDTLELLTKPTANSQNVKTKMAKGTIRHWGTRYDLVLPEISKKIGKSGDGMSRKSPFKTLILITDGVWTNYGYDSDSALWNRPFDSSWCETFKDNGVRVVVLYLEYPIEYNSYWVDVLVKPFADEIEPELRACASPGHYYKAGDKPEIQAELTKMAKHLRRPTLAFSK